MFNDTTNIDNNWNDDAISHDNVEKPASYKTSLEKLQNFYGISDDFDDVTVVYTFNKRDFLERAREIWRDNKKKTSPSFEAWLELAQKARE